MAKPFGNWFHSFDEPGLQIEGTRSVPYQLKKARIIPDDLSGKSVVDLGAGQGFYSRLAERRGADHVVGVNYDPTCKPQFEYVREQTGSDVEWRVADIFEITEDFDVVICMGVLYHVSDPNALLDHIFDIADETICLASAAFASPLKKSWRYDSTTGETIGGRNRLWPRFYHRLTGIDFDESVPTPFWIDEALLERGCEIKLRHPFLTEKLDRFGVGRLPLDRVMPIGLRYGVRATVGER